MMTPQERQLSDSLTVQIENLKSLMKAVKELRASRESLNLRLVRVGEVTQEIADRIGHGHLTQSRIAAMLAAMDALDAAFVAVMPSHSVTPAIAIIDAIP